MRVGLEFVMHLGSVENLSSLQLRLQLQRFQIPGYDVGPMYKLTFFTPPK